MIQETIDWGTQPQTAQDLVFEFLKTHTGTSFTGFEISNQINDNGFIMTEGSCSRYLRYLRHDGKIESNIRRNENRKGKPFTEYFVKI